MQLDSTFIKALEIPFDSVLPVGAKKEIREQFNVSVHAPSKILAGGWTNLDISEEALRRVIEHRNYLNKFLAQFPKAIIEQVAQPETA